MNYQTKVVLYILLLLLAFGLLIGCLDEFVNLPGL